MSFVMAVRASAVALAAGVELGLVGVQRLASRRHTESHARAMQPPQLLREPKSRVVLPSIA